MIVTPFITVSVLAVALASAIHSDDRTWNIQEQLDTNLKLYEQKEFLNTILENLSDGVVVQDQDSGISRNCLTQMVIKPKIIQDY